MKRVITNKRNEEHDSKEKLQITTDSMCLEAYLTSNPDHSKRMYIVRDEFSMEDYRLNVGIVEMLTECGCPEADAISLLVMARKTLGKKFSYTKNVQIANVFCELLEVQGYSPEKILRVISDLGEYDAVALYKHKRLPSGFDRYFIVEGWENDGFLEELFREKEEEDAAYN